MTNFTKEQLDRINKISNKEEVKKEFKRGWNREQFKKAFNERGFTYTSFERELNLRSQSVSQAITRRTPRIDKLISAFLDVPLHVLWPNQYLCNGTPMHYHYRAETLSDEELEKLNDQVRDGDVNKPQIVIDNWNDYKSVQLPTAMKLD